MLVEENLMVNIGYHRYRMTLKCRGRVREEEDVLCASGSSTENIESFAIGFGQNTDA